MKAGEGSASLVSWSVAGAPLEPGTESGDLHVVAPSQHGVLVAAIDGLGHGPEAAAAAREAARVLQAHAEESVLPLVLRCHEELRRSRGVVMSVAFFDQRDDSVTWMGVGNVEGVLLRAPGGELSNEAIVGRGAWLVTSSLPCGPSYSRSCGVTR